MATFEREQQLFHKKAESKEWDVKMRFFDIQAGDALLYDAFKPDESRALKLRALARLGITAREGEKPLDAYLRVMAEENGLPIEHPVHPAIRNAVQWDSGVQRFVFFLA